MRISDWSSDVCSSDLSKNGGKAPEQNVDTNTPVEKARDAARARAGSAFMAQYKDRGFMLGDAGRDAANHQRQLNDMRGATTSQLLAVIRQSRAILEPLRDKEVQMRADAAGLPFDQVKAMSFSDQKLIKDAKGDPVGLTGDDYAKHAALTRGLKAMDVEVKGRRGAGQEKDDRDQSRDQDRKSVVVGTSVSVRVDTGGRRLIKKTKKRKRS